MTRNPNDPRRVITRDVDSNCVRANRELTLPVYDDIRNVQDPRDGMRVHLTGAVQSPSGTWWYNDGVWYSGDRLKVSITRETVGSNSEVVLSDFTIPDDTRIDVWQSQISILDGNNEDADIEIFDVTTASVIYEHNYNVFNNNIRIDDPIESLIIQDGNEIQVRAANNQPSNLEISGWLVWSLQSTLL